MSNKYRLEMFSYDFLRWPRKEAGVEMLASAKVDIET